MRENCLQDFDKHWNCLELNNHVSDTNFLYYLLYLYQSLRSGCYDYHYCLHTSEGQSRGVRFAVLF